MTARTERMALLLRRDDGRRRLPTLLAALAERLGRPLTPADVLPLERGDALRDASRVPRAASRAAAGPPHFSRWAPGAVSGLDAGLVAFAAAAEQRRVLYLPERGLNVGPVPVVLAEIAPHVRAIAEGATEECSLLTEDGRCGLRLDYQANDHEHGEPYPYELTVWGAEWLALAAHVLPFGAAAPAA